MCLTYTKSCCHKSYKQLELSLEDIRAILQPQGYQLHGLQPQHMSILTKVDSLAFIHATVGENKGHMLMIF